jgi:hypothetical protein
MNSPGFDDDKASCAAALRRHLQTAKSLRQQARQAPEVARKRMLLRQWQADRLARSYPDLLGSERFGLAARFFLSDLYGPKDFSSRDDEVERILPLLLSLLPVSALQTIALAVEVDALSEQLDAAMVAELDRAGAIERIDQEAYAAAYRSVGDAEDRERQIILIRATGDALERLSGKPLLGTLLKLMRGPAHLAGLADLHAFLENGLAAFRHMGKAGEFLDCIEKRERTIFRKLFNGTADPFSF